MVKNAGVDIYTKKINERFLYVQESFAKLLTQLSSEEKDSKIQANQVFYNACNNLRDLLPHQSQPNWLTQLITESQVFSTYPDKPMSNDRLLRSLMEHNHQVHAHKWDFNESHIENYQFDDIYNELKNNSRIPELFDTLIESLESIIHSGEIDSITIKETLLQLLSLIEQNKNGSFFSVKSVGEFVLRFIGNSVWIGIKEIGKLKIFAKAFEKSAKDMGIESENVIEGVKEIFRERYKNSIKQLSNRQAKSIELFPEVVPTKRLSQDKTDTNK